MNKIFLNSIASINLLLKNSFRTLFSNNIKLTSLYYLGVLHFMYEIRASLTSIVASIATCKFLSHASIKFSSFINLSESIADISLSLLIALQNLSIIALTPVGGISYFFNSSFVKFIKNIFKIQIFIYCVYMIIHIFIIVFTKKQYSI